MALTTAQRNAAGVALVAAIAGVAYGVRTIVRSGWTGSCHQRVEIAWSDGGVPANVKCMESSGLGSGQPMQVLGLCPGYSHCRICFDDSADGGGAALPDGIVPVDVTEAEVAFDGGPQVRCVGQGEPEVPCACSTGSNCEAQIGTADWAAAPIGETLHQWRGTGCHTKVCGELLGTSSWPAECPTGLGGGGG